MKKLIGVLLLGLSSQYANAGTIYTTYTGSQNGVTIRDSATLVQSFFFDPGFAVD
ncbi:Bacitracin synthase 3-ATP-dependent isoleucine adenylase-Isoleucine activase-ATP-dependent D-phenylalanine adenylase-D-phenylalanine activase-ATP-dependent histidine adenylase-Histidine activase-ATP-dependent D-aspartate adenylase-D-aspartate activase-ATP-dependent asparagine adenylase-Asparagine activase-Aspartate racemase-Phenylalanine racemase [ATP hydrolyzing], partial [Moritella viscosa]